MLVVAMWPYLPFQDIEKLTRHIQETGAHRIIILFVFVALIDWMYLRGEIIWRKFKKWMER